MENCIVMHSRLWLIGNNFWISLTVLLTVLSLPLSDQARKWFWFSTQTSSVTGLFLFLVAFTRATLVVLCCGENSKPFCPAELWPCTKYPPRGSKILDLNVLVTFYHLKSNFLEVSLNPCSLFWFIEIFPFLPSTCCFRRNFVLVPHMSLQVHFHYTEDQTFLLVNLRQLMTASNVGPCTQAWKAKWAVFKITGFACKHFLLSSLPNPSPLFTHVIFRKGLRGCLHEKTHTSTSFILGWLFDFLLRLHDDRVISYHIIWTYTSCW